MGSRLRSLSDVFTGSIISSCLLLSVRDRYSFLKIIIFLVAKTNKVMIFYL